ncbi:MAG TPA: hypothetical protein VHE30_28760 [Polyangiaceae bacterium]|nr:hypothetical protein [Polyangiaceae bacterium]
MKRTVPFLLVLLALTTRVGDAPSAEQDARLGELLPKLAITSQRFETMLALAAFTATGRTETVDGDGTVSAVKEGVFRFRPHGDRHVVDVIRYTEDGEDRRMEAQEKFRDAEKKDIDPDDVTHVPFLGSEQAKYVFKLGATDPRDPNRVRVHFRARKPARTLWNGSAWVDARTGDLLTMGAVQSKTALFVDYFSGTLELGAQTKLGPAVSRATFEGGGGFLFFRKRFRGRATVTDYALP